MASFEIPTLEFLYNVNRKYPSLKTCLKYPITNQQVRPTACGLEGRREKTGLPWVSGGGGDFGRFPNFSAEPAVVFLRK